MASRSWLVVLIFAARAALAQTAAIDGVDLSRGTTLPPGSSALADEATALVFNPAGLGRAGSLNLWYAHERSNPRNQDNDGLWLAAGLGDLAGLGVGFEWLRPGDGAAPRAMSSLGLAVGPEVLSAGATLHWLFGGATQGLLTADLGLQSRPTRWLALGALARNVAAPAPLAREWTLGLGLRPFGERLTLGLDWVVPEVAALPQSRLQYTAQLTVVRGLRVLAGVSHAFDGRAPLFVHGGLGLDLEHFGYTQGLGAAQGQLAWQFAVRASVDPVASVVPQEKIAVLSLADLAEPSGGTLGALLGLDGDDRHLRLLRFLDGAARDPELRALVLKVEGSGLGLARADEVRAAVGRLRAAGKKVYAYVLSMGDAEYLMASACDGLYAAPEAMVLVDGLRSSVTYFGGAARRLGVEVDVARVGAFKNTPDQYTRVDMSDEQREALSAWLDTAQRVVAERVQGSRGIAPAAWQAAVDEGLKSSRRSVELKQLDGVLTPQAFDELLRAELPDARVARGYTPFGERDGRWGPQPVIAVIPVLGNITGGKDQASPLGGDLVAGAQSFMEALGRAADDDAVKAIVVRVDSGGGDGLASDLMYRAVLAARKKKPVVASMGDTAASGGYYVAMGAERVFASPATLTGSIGVFFAKPSWRTLAEDLGVRQESLSRGRLAGITDLTEPWTDAQRAAAQRWVDDFYDTFITEVASARSLDKARVDAVARGRIWSGADAQARGLVDELGGLMDAVAWARRKADVGDDAAVRLYRSPRGLASTLLGAAAPQALLDVELPRAPLPPALQALARALGPAAWLLEPPRLQARLEHDVKIE